MISHAIFNLKALTEISCMQLCFTQDVSAMMKKSNNSSFFRNSLVILQKLSGLYCKKSKVRVYVNIYKVIKLLNKNLIFKIQNYIKYIIYYIII